jgi:hypothetical protein
MYDSSFASPPALTYSAARQTTKIAHLVNASDTPPHVGALVAAHVRDQYPYVVLANVIAPPGDLDVPPHHLVVKVL